MTATVAIFPLDRIRRHPENVRIDAVADDAMVESIKSVGLIDPLLCVQDPEDPDGLLVIDGNRRHDGATKAELVSVPVRIRHDLVTLAQQVEVMAITGLQKEALSPVEEARAYEQLALLGMDDDAIAQSTGFTPARIRQRRRLTALSNDAQVAVHSGQASLVDVARIDEVAAGDPAVAAQLEQALGTPEFGYALQEIRAARARAERHAKTVEEWSGAGVPDHSAMHPDTIETYRQVHGTVPDLAKKHDGCLAYIRPTDGFYGPYLVCTAPARHTTPPTAPVVSEWEKKRLEREERAARFAAAGAARAEWITDHLAAQFPARGHGPLAKVAKILLPLAEAHNDDLRSQFDAAPSVSNTKVLQAFAAWVAQYLASELDRDIAWIDTATEARRVLDAWDWLTQAGYELSKVDREQRALMETRYAELAADEAGD